MRSQETLVAVVLVSVVGVGCYCNTFSSPFVFDDMTHIVQKETLHCLWPPWTPLLNSHRPVAEFSFALNYGLDNVLSSAGCVGEIRGREAPWHAYHYWAYHAVNLGIHIAAALTLFGIVRRTLSGGKLAERYGQAAWGLALGVALIWLAHPLQTESVTYIYQRFESLMGMLFLLTFYCFIRAQDSPRAGWWYAASFVACFLAMASKEVAAVAPPLLVWYDRALLSSSWRELLHKRWPFYASLGGVLVLLALLMVQSLPMYTGGGILVVENVSPLEYARSQPGVILHYLRLSVWPQGQTLDYGWPVATSFLQVVPPLVILLTLLGLTVWCIWRHPAWGFLGGWFFLILAPTSSFVPIKDLAFEHRMYLPLAAVVVSGVVASCELLRRLPVRGVGGSRLRPMLRIVLLAVAVGALGWATYLRNQVYFDEVSLWQDVVRKSPRYVRGHSNLGLAYQLRGQTKEAETVFRRTLELDPDWDDAHYALGQIFFETDREEAIRHYTKCLDSKAWFLPHAHQSLGLLFLEKGNRKEAMRHLETAVRLLPDDVRIRNTLAGVVAQDDPEAALRLFDESLRLKPGDLVAVNNRAMLLDRCGRRQEALECCRQGLQQHPESVDLHFQYAEMVASEQPETAIEHLVEATERAPRFLEAHLFLGHLYARCGRLREAVARYRHVLALRPGHEEARRSLSELVQSAQSQSARSPSGSAGASVGEAASSGK